MLKIKREKIAKLWEFGFKKMKDLPRYCFSYGDNEDFHIYVSMLDGDIWLDDNFVGIPNVIYDLIEAGMVEKGNENE